ncbi:MAG: HAMP domain-containing histidine kinase [Candidatus Eremiobacteraeota bacterium]|nr:HAMP domain-containing histidine kinase [Candidatus Eremiobacteraeota bacterium]
MLHRPEHTNGQEEMLALLGRLSAGVVHDARNMLCNMVLLVDRVEALLDDEDQDQRVTRGFDRIHESMRDMNEMLSSVLEVAREQPALDRLDLARLTEETLRLVRPTVRERGVRLQFESQPDIQIHGLSVQLRQVLCNLVLNASEALDRHGEIQVSVSCHNGWAVLTVDDNGPGVPAEQRARIFSPFFTAKAGGSGLGLWNCQRIVGEHGGSIEVDESPLGGARFSVRIPLAEAAIAA